MTLEERIERLEKLWERDRQTLEMAGVLIERLTEVLIKYWSVSGRHHYLVMQDLRVLSNSIGEHFQSHYSKEKYKRETTKPKRNDNKYIYNK